jgi:hypothetical protein
LEDRFKENEAPRKIEISKGREGESLPEIGQ